MKSIPNLFFGLVTLLCSCEDNLNKKKSCPGFSIIPESPYDNPIWHPSGNFIGFNHWPLKEIQYKNGFDCPRQATYVHDLDSIGFYLVDSDGLNKRMIWPEVLLSPAWSPDGKWVAFVEGGQIFKMSFDGEKFDTLSMEQLTFEGENFFPSWSPDGNSIAYDSNAESPTGLSFVWIMNIDGSDKMRVAFTPSDGETRMPDWLGNDSLIYKGADDEIYKISLNDGHATQLTSLNVSPPGFVNTLPKFSPQQQRITFLKGQSQLFSMNRDGSTLKPLEMNTIINFSWSPTDRIVVVKHDYKRIDEINGTLWTMKADGSDFRTLTFNKMKISN